MFPPGLEPTLRVLSSRDNRYTIRAKYELENETSKKKLKTFLTW